jgi:AcrR family transcriptional regulator
VFADGSSAGRSGAVKLSREVCVTETPSLTRRDRLRAATMEEITATARRLLVEQGPEAASLRAIAREMGMTAPGLYRYYGSREELLRHVIAEIFRELAADIRRAIHQAVEPAPAGEARQPTHLALKMVAACQEFRHWSLTHRDEFALLFGVPLPEIDDGRFDIAEECALEFAGDVLHAVPRAVERRPLPDTR